MEAHQLQLTIADIVDEAHDTHHPTSPRASITRTSSPKPRRRAADFIANRIPKYLRLLRADPRTQPAGAPASSASRVSCCDLSLFQLVAGLRYAPSRGRWEHWRLRFPRVGALHEASPHGPPRAACLQSPRRIAFNEHGIFRHYPELDAAH